MRTRAYKTVLAVLAVIALFICTVVQAAALDDKYTFDDIGMSLKIPKNLTVITKNAEREDEVFVSAGLDYDETITAFNAAHIYLQALEPEGSYRITLTVMSDENSKSINNYSDITALQREEIVQNFLSDPMCTSAVEIKHGGNYFIDLTLESEEDGEQLYINQCNTVINGLNINLTLRKSAENILNEESKVLTNIANSLTFDKIILNSSGPSFEWWRVLLWIAILAVLSVGISLIYQRYNTSQKRKLEERRHRHAALLEERQKRENPDSADTSFSSLPKDENEPTFEEVLGYESDKDYQSRAATDLESFDINVKEKNPQSGVSFFEDNGDSIDDGTDYFDTYFKEPTQMRTPVERATSTVGAYIKIAFHHLGFFFQNIFRAIAKIFKGNKTKS